MNEEGILGDELKSILCSKLDINKENDTVGSCVVTPMLGQVSEYRMVLTTKFSDVCSGYIKSESLMQILLSTNGGQQYSAPGGAKVVFFR